MTVWMLFSEMLLSSLGTSASQGKRAPQNLPWEFLDIIFPPQLPIECWTSLYSELP